ncbi:probable G-protein coupled receptor No18 [Ptychodera flava]|uniref:probable G-protein coupled receptor No18 n=1 Tax=Ptychodera flava TaxID=63121 RepID=UPI00396AAA8E
MRQHRSRFQGVEDVHGSLLEALIEGITLAIIALLSIVFNLIGCYIILKNPSFRTKIHFKLLLSLSLCDLMLAVTGMPLSIVSVFMGSELLWTFQPVCMLSGFVSCSVLATSTFGLTAISLDRYFAISTPLKYRDYLQSKKINVVIISVWVLGVIIGLIPFFGWSPYAYNEGSHHCSPQWTSGCGYYTFAAVTVLVIPVCIMATSYLCIYQKLKQRFVKAKPGMLRMHPPRGSQFPETSIANVVDVDDPPTHVSAWDNSLSTSGNKSSNSTTLAGRQRSNQVKRRICLRTERKVAITGAILILVYFICWLPYAIVNSCYLSGVDFHRYIRVTATWLLSSNSAVNPIIYTWTNQQVREKVIDLFRKS